MAVSSKAVQDTALPIGQANNCGTPVLRPPSPTSPCHPPTSQPSHRLSIDFFSFLGILKFCYQDPPSQIKNNEVQRCEGIFPRSHSSVEAGFALKPGSCAKELVF